MVKVIKLGVYFYASLGRYVLAEADHAGGSNKSHLQRGMKNDCKGHL